ncbi:VWA domain-containing protein [Vibrio cholerae]|nr:VWA domain-containing protein [Vibrio cholerae]EJK2101626.1 VWA domain-containing protein [Vibrio cholerae]EJL6647178.1 VWA domain-containing protein [Vibrio cholerae]EJL6950863.1 VWA domain-containing protein [Vibrio cholerae]EKF9424723.1 VWA domain-containing protein [Vibrio cholerae]
MFDPKKFTTPTAKPLPVVLLLDVSSSMSGDKIDNLNKAVKDMLDTFAQEEKMETEILVSVITFGNQVELQVPYTKASQVQWQGLQANGMTPMGTALKMAKAMIEDKETTPSRAYRPTIILVSDGQPNDSWEGPLEDFISDGRSSKCFCWAMGIGQGADKSVLERFISKTPFLAKDVPNRVFDALEAKDIHHFFQLVTMSLTRRNQSKNPNEVAASIELVES